MAGGGEEQLGPERAHAPLRARLSRLLLRPDPARPPPAPAPVDAEAPPPPPPADDASHHGRAHGLARQRVGPHEDAHTELPLDTASSRRSHVAGGAAGARHSHGSAAAQGSAGSSERGSMPLEGKPSKGLGGKASLVQEDSLAMGSQIMLPEHAAKLFANMNQQALVEEGATRSRRGVIHPLSRGYRAWWYITILAACFTGWLEPFKVAYLDHQCWTDDDALSSHPAALLSTLTMILFLVDIVVSFFVGYFDESGALVTELRRVAYRYFTGRLKWDILTTLPWDVIVLAATNTDCGTQRARWLMLLALLKLGRMYRLFVMFKYFTYNLALSLLMITLLRNLAYVVYLLHWASCCYFFISQQTARMGQQTWRSQDKLQGLSIAEQYIYTFYWAIVTFATLGYGDLTPWNTAEVVFTILYVTINMLTWAYILGTITLLVTKQDEEIGKYRERMQVLVQYCDANHLPRDLKANMQGLLRLHMSLQGEATSDEAVLAVFPTSIRRRILRQLYKEPLDNCYLFKNCGRKFMDAIMTTARVELFLPKVEIVASMDHVNELYVIVAGYVEVVDETSQRPSARAALAADPTAAPVNLGSKGLSRMSTLPPASGANGLWASARNAALADVAVEDDPEEIGMGREILGPGDSVAEVAYFTEVPKADSVRCLTVCRVLVLPRSSYTAIAANFPMSARQVLENLKMRAEELVRQHVPEELAESLLKGRSTLGGATGGRGPAYAPAYAHSPGGSASAAAMEDGTALGPVPTPHVPGEAFRRPPGQARAPGEPPGGGDGGGLSRRGRAPGSGLSAVSMSAFARAHSMARTLSPIRDASAHAAAAALATAKSDSAAAAVAAAAGSGAGAGAAAGAAPAPKRMLLSSLSMPLGGARRVAAAMEGIASAAAVVEDGGGAGHGDDWGLTLQQQRIVADLMRLRQLVHKAVSKMDQSQLEAMLYAAGSGDADAVQGLLRQGMSPDSANAEGTTPLILAASKGHNDVVLALLFNGADPSKCDAAGRSPLLLACQGNHGGVLDILLRHGAKLGMEPVMLAAYLCKIVFEGKMDELRRLLRARADANVVDYDKQSPLHIAAAEGNLPAARVLVEQGGASVTLKDRWGRTPLDTALKACATQVVEYLESRPEIRQEHKERARQRFEQERTDELLNGCMWGDVATVRSMLSRGCPVDCRDYDGRTALFVAAVNGQADVARALLDAGADANARNSFGSCPLLEACLTGHENVVDMLLAAGARLNQPEVEEAALLSTVIHSGDHALLRRLLRCRANPAAADYDGRTPLHVAASRGDTDSLAVIAAAEDDPGIVVLQAVQWDVKDRSGLTPDVEAERAGHKAAAALLRARLQAARAAGRAAAAAAAAGGGPGPAVAGGREHPGGFALRFGRPPSIVSRAGRMGPHADAAAAVAAAAEAAAAAAEVGSGPLPPSIASLASGCASPADSPPPSPRRAAAAAAAAGAAARPEGAGGGGARAP